MGVPCDNCSTADSDDCVCTANPCQCACHALGDGRYHVWCLTWDDDEAYGSDVVGFDVCRDGWKSSTKTTVYVASELLYDARRAVERYADYCHAMRDGWEATWPLTFRVRKPDGTTEDFEVERETVPEFTARPVRKVAR